MASSFCIDVSLSPVQYPIGQDRALYCTYRSGLYSNLCVFLCCLMPMADFPHSLHSLSNSPRIHQLYPPPSGVPHCPFIFSSSTIPYGPNHVHPSRNVRREEIEGMGEFRTWWCTADMGVWGNKGPCLVTIPEFRLLI